jgi:hypothetical protein
VGARNFAAELAWNAMPGVSCACGRGDVLLFRRRNAHAARQTPSEIRCQKKVQSRDPVVVIEAHVVTVVFAHDFQAV